MFFSRIGGYINAIEPIIYSTDEMLVVLCSTNTGQIRLSHPNCIFSQQNSERGNLAYNIEMYLRDLEINMEPQAMDPPLDNEWAQREHETNSSR